MTLQLSSMYLTITGSIVILILFILDLKNIKSFKEIYTDKNILLMLFITCIIFFVYMRTMPYEFWSFDDSFYLPFMYENADTTKLLSVQPRTGESIDKIMNIYATQGYYMIGSYFISLYNIFKSALGLKFGYVAIAYYFMAFPSFLALILVCVGMAKELTDKRWKNILFVSLFIFFTIFLAIDSNLLNNVIMTGYVGPFVTLTIYIPFILLCLSRYFKGERSYAKLLMGSFFTLLSFASFNIFLIFVLIYVLLFMQFVFKKKLYLKDYIIMLIPELIFLVDFVIGNNIVAFIGQILMVILLILYFKFGKVLDKLEITLFKILKCIVYALPFIFFVLSSMMIMFNIDINCSSTDYITKVIDTIFPLFGTNEFHYSAIFITGFYLLLLACFIYMGMKKSDNKKYVCAYIIIILSVFLNPFTIPFVSTYITSETYNRLFILILNPFVCYFIFEISIKNFDTIKFKKISKDSVVITFCILFALLSILIELKEFNYWVGRTGRSDKTYRMRQRDVVAVKKLNKFVANNNIDNIVIATNHSELKIIDPKIYSLYDRTFDNKPNSIYTKKAYYISVLYGLNRGEINQEYYNKYKSDNIMDVFDYLGVNFVTIDINCPEEKKNYTSNVLCKTPKKDKENPLIYEAEKKDYIEDKKIYNDLKKHLQLVYQTDRYKLYYVK